MRYKSTRGGVSGLSFEEAPQTAHARHAGRIIPANIPQLNEKALQH